MPIHVPLFAQSDTAATIHQLCVASIQEHAVTILLLRLVHLANLFADIEESKVAHE